MTKTLVTRKTIALLMLTVAAQWGCSLNTTDSEVESTTAELGTGQNLSIKKIAVLDYSTSTSSADLRSAWVQVTFENKGTASTPATTMDWYLSTDRKIVPGVDTFLKTTTVPALAAKQRVVVERVFSGSNYPYLAATQFVGVLIDPSNTIVEDKETDNSKSSKAKAGDATKLLAALINKSWMITPPEVTCEQGDGARELCQDFLFTDTIISGGGGYQSSWHRRYLSDPSCEGVWDGPLHENRTNVRWLPDYYSDSMNNYVPPFYGNDGFFIPASAQDSNSIMPAVFFYQNVKTEMHFFNSAGDWVWTATKGLCPTGS